MLHLVAALPATGLALGSSQHALRLLPALILSISCLMLVQDTFTGNLLEAGRKTDSDLYDSWHGLEAFLGSLRTICGYESSWIAAGQPLGSRGLT